MTTYKFKIDGTVTVPSGADLIYVTRLIQDRAGAEVKGSLTKCPMAPLRIKNMQLSKED
jgi:hypothetical protein